MAGADDAGGIGKAGIAPNLRAVRAGLLESFSRVCQECGGRGVLLFEEAATSGGPVPWTEEAEG